MGPGNKPSGYQSLLSVLASQPWSWSLRALQLSTDAGPGSVYQTLRQNVNIEKQARERHPGGSGGGSDGHVQAAGVAGATAQSVLKMPCVVLGQFWGTLGAWEPPSFWPH